MKNIKVDSIVKVKSINFNGRIRVIAVERGTVFGVTLQGKVIVTNIRNIREDK